MKLTDNELLEALRNRMQVENKTAEELLQFDSTYIGERYLTKLVLSDMQITFQELDYDESLKLVRHLAATSGRNINYIRGEHLCCNLRWVCSHYSIREACHVPIVVHTPVILDKISAYLLYNRKSFATVDGKYCTARYDTPYLEFNNGAISKLVIRNSDPASNRTISAFVTTLDKLYEAIYIRKVEDGELFNLNKVGDLRLHDLYLDYRRENIGSNPEEARRSRNKIRNETILAKLREHPEEYIAFSSRQDVKPWLPESPMNLVTGNHDIYKNVYKHQKKFVVKMQTVDGQILVGSVYSSYVGAMYSDAYIYKHWDDVPNAKDKLNFPDYRIPVQCMCGNCMSIERKRGPQPRIDKMYYVEEYKNE